jgi:TonB family protein
MMGTVRRVFLILLGTSATIGAAQNPVVRPDSIKDPRALFSAVGPFYDFADPALKPWHLRASYQTYDPSGNPASDASYEYWWVSPKVYRSTWSRGGSSHSEWYTADGRKFQKDEGEGPHLFKTDFPAQLLTPLPEEAEVESKENHLERQMIRAGKVKVPCVDVVENPTAKLPNYHVRSRYCFDPANPILIAKTIHNGIGVTYGDFAQFQGRNLSRLFVERVDDRDLLTAKVNAVGRIDAADAIFTPPADAKPDGAGSLGIPAKVMQGARIGGPVPEYPEKAKAVHLTGSVMIEAVIGKDGKIHDLQVVSSPGALLSESASKAVSRWEYKPYLMNGEAVEVRTTIFVTYAMSF